MNGEIVGESVGGTVRDYLLDPLGSVVATLDAGGLVDQFEYWPYGELVDDLPEGAPEFLWVGGPGYWFDTDERRYVRHRMLRTDLGSWMQLDPLWPLEVDGLGAVSQSPTMHTDWLGLFVEEKIPKLLLERPPVRGWPTPLPGGGPASGTSGLPPGVVAATRVCILVAGAEAIYELCNYSPGTPAGPLTSLGDWIGQKCFPSSDFLPADPKPLPKPRPVPWPHPEPIRHFDTPWYCPPPPPPKVDYHYGPNSRLNGKVGHSHYFEKLGCCCFADHTHIIEWWVKPDCTVHPQRRDGECYGLCIPIPCKRQ